jgi:hypothetical protein
MPFCFQISGHWEEVVMDEDMTGVEEERSKRVVIKAEVAAAKRESEERRHVKSSPFHTPL